MVSSFQSERLICHNLGVKWQVLGYNSKQTLSCTSTDQVKQNFLNLFRSVAYQPTLKHKMTGQGDDERNVTLRNPSWDLKATNQSRYTTSAVSMLTYQRLEYSNILAEVLPLQIQLLAK